MPNLGTISYDALYSLFKGEPGTRKSTQALSYPKPQYWISSDQKMEALARPASMWGINFSDIEFDDYNDWDAPRKKLESLQVNCKYKTLIIDSITSTGDNINRQTRKFKSSDGQGKKVGGISVNSMEDFNAESVAFSELIALTKDIHKFHKIHVILIAHVIGQRKPTNDNSLTQFSRIIATGGEKISVKIPAYCTEAYHFDITPSPVVGQEGKYGLTTVHTGNDFARTSLELPQRIDFGSEPLYGKYIEPAIQKLKLNHQTNPIVGVK